MTLAFPTCKDEYMLAGTYGFIVSVTGLDRLFGPAAPPAVHAMLAGYGADYQCRKSFNYDRRAAMATAAGVAGALAGKMIVGGK